MKKFEEGSVDKIELVYNKFKNAATQIVTTEQFLPIVPSADGTDANQDYIFEPSKSRDCGNINSKIFKNTIVQSNS